MKLKIKNEEEDEIDVLEFEMKMNYKGEIEINSYKKGNRRFEFTIHTDGTWTKHNNAFLGGEQEN